MRHLSRIPLGLLIGLTLNAPVRAGATVAPAAGSPCGRPVAVIGADVTPANLPPLRRALGVTPGTTALRETLADERAQAHGLIPPVLLGIVAVSSVLLSPRPRGAGLDVTVTTDVTRDAAATYANALLTAGMTDATVRVDAPPSQKALGTTALLGLLRAAEVSCAAISPARRDLAIREIALTDSLASSIGPRGAAARLLFALKRDAVDGGLVTPAALAALIARDAAARGTSMPPALQPALAAYLRDLVASRAYAAIAAARPSVGGPPPLRAIVRLAGNGVGVTGGAGTARGTVTAAGGARLVVRQAEGTRTYQPSPAVPVYRNGAPSARAAIQAGDAVTVTTDANGRPTRIDATSAKTVGAGVTTRGAIVRGVAAAGGVATGLAVRRANGSLRIYHPAPGVPVYRNGQPSSLGAIRRDDAVTVTTNAAGQPTRIDATATSTTNPATGTGTGAVAPSGHGAVVRGVAAAAVGSAGLAVTQTDGTHTYRPVPGLPVYRNGMRSTLGAIRPTDAVTVTMNAAGEASRIDATAHAGGAHGGLYHGTIAMVVAAGARALAVKEAGGTRTYRVAPDAPVYRDGKPSSLSALKATDTVTGTTDAAGATTRIEATRAPAAVVAPAGITPLLAGLGALAALLLLLLLLLRRRRRRPVVITTTVSATGPAVRGALEHPASEPLADWLHDGKDIAE